MRDEQKWPYSLYIGFDTREPGRSGILIHCEKIGDAFRKLLTVSPQMFSGNSCISPFLDYNISKAVIVAEDRKETIAELYYDYYRRERIPGIYLAFPESISAFERESGISLSSLKGYQPSIPSLLLAYAMPQDDMRFKPTIGYENLCEEASRSLKEETRVFISFVKKFFNLTASVPRSLTTVPFREDFLYSDSNEALRHLLQTDFNALNESVAWENDVPFYIQHAGIYKFNDRLGFTDLHAAYLKSIRIGPVAIGHNSITEPGVYLELAKSKSNIQFSYPFHLRPPYSNDGTVYLVGTYNDALSKTEKLVGLLTPFEKTGHKLTENKKPKNDPVRAKTGKTTQNKRKPRGL